jgi:uncharacterized protein with PIN domain
MLPKPAHIAAVLTLGLLAFAAYLHLRELRQPDFERCPLCNQKITVKL